MTKPRMNLRINFKSGKPVPLQIIDQIKEDAASGALLPGEPLPSVSSVAAELRVNRNAIAKAYSELESAGLIERLPGKGYFLREKDSPAGKELRRKALTAEIGQAIVQAPQAVQKTLTYSLLTALLAALYFGLVGGIGVLIVRAGLIRGELVAVLSTVVVAAVFMPVRAGVQKLVDRFIFAKRYELPRALMVIKAEAPSQPDLDSFMRRVTERTEPLLDARLDLIREYGAMLPLVNAHPLLRATRAPLAAGSDLLMPVFSDNELLAILRLTARNSGKAFDAEDSEFLASVGEQVAISANQFRLRRERQDAETALDIQRGLLPREIPQIAGFTIAGAWQPARTVGGDYYDVLTLGGKDLALIVADVSGKGMPAALLMANLQATVKAYATVDPSPKELCERVNRAICGSITTGKFITFFYAVLDAAAHRLTYTNAGHNAPLVVRKDGSCVKLETGGPVLGIFGDAAYEQDAVDLAPGDRLLICTDGIIEAADPSGGEFGEENLIAILRKNPSAAATDLRDTIIQTVTRFCADDFADDATLLTVAVDEANSGTVA